jgi:ABC-type glycerol-3-phosphate transport system substrate-binding protein
MKLKKMVLGLLALLGAVVLVACGAGTKKSADFQLLTQG